MSVKEKRTGYAAAAFRFAVCVTVCFLFVSVFGCRVRAASVHVFDEASLLSDEESGKLEEKLQSFADETKMELGFVSTDSLDGKTTREYADDFYDNSGLGLDEEASGALLLIDMENREIYISTCGKMQNYLTDDRIERVLDAVIDGMDSGFYQAAVNFVDETASYVAAGYEEHAHQYQEETGEITYTGEDSRKKGNPLAVIAAALAAGLLVGVFRYTLTKSRYKSYGEPDTYSYAGERKVQFSKKDDRVINRFVTHRRLPPPPPPTASGGSSFGGASDRSTVHTSSSGRSHGGGGRSF